MSQEEAKRALFGTSGGKRTSSDDEDNVPQKKRVRESGVNHKYLNVDELCDKLKENGVNKETIDIIKGAGIDGRSLDNIWEENLTFLGVKPEMRDKVLKTIKPLRDPLSIPSYNLKVFNDSIHGHIEFHPLLVAVIDTPQFQRLRWIKQLGVAYMVFPGASHNRFEHSLGVSHLAGKFVRYLDQHQPELCITKKDIICVEMAGLCHDLGHGPFSHVFDNKFMPKVEPECTWKHEDASIAMFKYMMEENGLEKEFKRYGLTDEDIVFIKELIRGPLNQELREKIDEKKKEYANEKEKKEKAENDQDQKTAVKIRNRMEKLKKDLIAMENDAYRGRPTEKRFLYEIVANKRTEIDVDKWDYFARDCHHLGVKAMFDDDRFMRFCRVIKSEDGVPMICCREKEASNLYDMFTCRANLHRKAYKHKTNQNLENMLLQALEKANNKHLMYSGKDRKKYILSECRHDMAAYSKLTDSVLLDIMNSDHPDLLESREILKRMQSRQLFQFVGETRPMKEIKIPPNEAQTYRDQIAEICASLERDQYKGTATVDWKDQLIGQIVSFDFGMGGLNPIDNMLFYCKERSSQVFLLKKDEVSRMLPQNCAECRFRLYCKSEERRVQELATEGWKKWCEEHRLRDSSPAGIEFTPQKFPTSPFHTRKSRDSLGMD